MLSYEEIPGWCAGCKVSGVTSHYLKDKTFPSVEEMMTQAVKQENASVIVVSVNADELPVLVWLKANKFRKGATMRNYLHGGRKTWLYQKQIPERLRDAARAAREGNGDREW